MGNGTEYISLDLPDFHCTFPVSHLQTPLSQSSLATIKNKNIGTYYFQKLGKITIYEENLDIDKRQNVGI